MLTASIQFQKKKILNYALNGIKDNGRPGAHSQSPFHNYRTTKYCEVPCNISGSILARINPKRACICDHLRCCIQLDCYPLHVPTVLLHWHPHGLSCSIPPLQLHLVLLWLSAGELSLGQRVQVPTGDCREYPPSWEHSQGEEMSDTKRFRRNEQAPQASWIYTSGEINKRCFLYTVISHRVCIVSFILHLTAGLLSPQGMIKP